MNLFTYLLIFFSIVVFFFNLLVSISDAKTIMAPHEFVEIRLVCKADYLDPQLKLKLHEIKDKLREILHTGMKRFVEKCFYHRIFRTTKIRSEKSATME